MKLNYKLKLTFLKFAPPVKDFGGGGGGGAVQS